MANVLHSTPSLEANSRNCNETFSESRTKLKLCSASIPNEIGHIALGIFSTCVDKYLVLLLVITNLFFKSILNFLSQILKNPILKFYLKTDHDGYVKLIMRTVSETSCNRHFTF